MAPNTFKFQSEEVDEIDKTKADEFISNLFDKGSRTDGLPTGEADPSNIPWIDFALIEKGQAFLKRHFAAILFLQMMGESLGFAAKQIASPIFRTLTPFSNCQKRFLSTRKTIYLDWFEAGFQSETFLKAMKRVNFLHKQRGRPCAKEPTPTTGYGKEFQDVVAAVKADLLHVEMPSNYPAHQVAWEPLTYFSQMDIAYLQLMWIPLYFYPERMGVYPQKGKDDQELREGIKGFIHMHAVVGRCLGLQDEFNIGLHANESLYKELERITLLPGIKGIDEAVAFAMNQVTNAYFKRMTFGLASYKGLLQVVFDDFDVKGTELWGTMGIKDKAFYWVSKSLLWALRFDFVRAVMNAIIMFQLKLEVRYFLDK